MPTSVAPAKKSTLVTVAGATTVGVAVSVTAALAGSRPGLEPPRQPQPLVVTGVGVGRGCRMQVGPMLEGIDGRHPWEKLDDALKMIALRPAGVLLGIKLAQVRRGE